MERLHVTLLTTTQALEQFCARALSSPILALDTEFLRERNYYPKLCLLQLATEKEIVLVDPLQISDMSCLKDLFTSPKIVKIAHACSQDMEVLLHEFGCIPTPLFDTQLAASFLGYRLQIGYGPLVESMCATHLPKSASLTDWSQRPLDAEQLVYAEDDVRYLPEIYNKMQEQLVARDRMAWVMPAMQELCDTTRYKHNPYEAYTHVKRISSLTRKQLGIAREICAWREKTAQKRNIPRRWVLSDELVCELTKRAPKNSEAMRKIRGCNELSDTDIQSCLIAIEKGKQCTDAQLPRAKKHIKVSADMESTLDLMGAMVRHIAHTENIAAQILATREDLYDFVMHRSTSRIATTWRQKVVGEKLDGLLSGKLGLTIKDNHVEIL